MPRFRLNFRQSPRQLTCGSTVITVPAARPLTTLRTTRPETLHAAQQIQEPQLPPPLPAATATSPGVSAAELTGLTDLLATVAENLQELREQQRRAAAEMQQTTVELAVAAASWLTGVAISANMFAVDDLIRMALQQLQIDSPVVVHLHPQDHALLQQLLTDSPDAALLEQVSCVDDPGLARGSCRVACGRRTLISDMDSRLEEIRRLWMENLDAAQVERRGDGPHGRALRRFPDRRETA